MLHEAGSYGYLVRVRFSSDEVAGSAEDRVIRVRLAVTESSYNSGGLCVYGERFGRFPLDPTVIFHRK